MLLVFLLILFKFHLKGVYRKNYTKLFNEKIKHISFFFEESCFNSLIFLETDVSKALEFFLQVSLLVFQNMFASSWQVFGLLLGKACTKSLNNSGCNFLDMSGKINK